MSRPLRILGYARVSSELQAGGSSLGDQDEVLRRHAMEQHGMPVSLMFVEAESSLREKYEFRERMQALMGMARKGDLVICDKIDRWSRDPEFTYTSMRLLREREAAVYFVGDQCDPSTSEGDTMLNFRVVFAREEHKRIQQRMVGTRNLLRDRGYYVEGKVPFGYRRPLAKGEKGPNKNILVVVEVEAAIVHHAFCMCAAGASLREILKAHPELGSKANLGKILRHRAYIGEQKNTRGEWIKGKHPAIIDPDLFARATASRGARDKGGRAISPSKPAETSTWLLRKLARCALCGARMLPIYGGTKRRRLYYYGCARRCAGRGQAGRHNRLHVPVPAIEAAAEPLIVARLTELRKELARDPAPVAPVAANVDLAERRAKLERRRERYLEAFADEHMSRDELRAVMAKVDTQILALDAQASAESKPSPLADPAVRRAMLGKMSAIEKLWSKASPEEKRAIAEQLATAGPMANGAPLILTFAWRTAEELAEMSL